MTISVSKYCYSVQEFPAIQKGPVETRRQILLVHKIEYQETKYCIVN